MKKFKKALTGIVSALLIASSVLPMAACGDNNSESSSSGTSEVVIHDVAAYDGSKVTITFYHTMGATLRNVLDTYIKDFNKIYPNITVTHKQVGDYDTARDQIVTEVNAGRSPNIAYCYPDHVSLYNKAKAVVQLDHYIESKNTVAGTTEIMGFTDDQKADFIEGYYAEGSVYGDGYTYTLPFSKSTEVLYYNKTYFEKNKLTVPTTWDEMEDVCKKIKDNEGSSVIPFAYDSESNWFITMTEQLGTPYTAETGKDRFLFNTEENRNFVARFSEWYQKGYVTTKELLNGAYTSSLFTETATGKQKCYMCIGSSAGASYQCPDLGSDNTYPFEVGVAMIPQANTESPKVIQQGPSLCIFNKDNEQEIAASWLFAKFFTTNVEFQAQFSMESGYVPVIKSARENDIYKNFLNTADGNANLQATCVKMGLDQMNAYYVSPAFVGSSAARDTVGEIMTTCFVNAKGSTSYISEMFEAAVKALQKKYKF